MKKKDCTWVMTNAWDVKYSLKKANVKPNWYIPCIEATSNWLSKNLVNGFEHCPYCGKSLFIKEK